MRPAVGTLISLFMSAWISASGAGHVPDADLVDGAGEEAGRGIRAGRERAADGVTTLFSALAAWSTTRDPSRVAVEIELPGDAVIGHSGVVPERCRR